MTDGKIMTDDNGKLALAAAESQINKGNSNV